MQVSDQATQQQQQPATFQGGFFDEGCIMFTVVFVKSALERAIRTAAQALLALWATDIAGVLSVDWLQSGSVAALAALTSILMSIIATGTADKGSASFVSEDI